MDAFGIITPIVNEQPCQNRIESFGSRNSRPIEGAMRFLFED
jgi:hypothetical protein